MRKNSLKKEFAGEMYKFKILHMRFLIMVLFFISFNRTAFSQTITYDIPEEYKKDITRDDYKKIVDISLPIIQKRFGIESVKQGSIQLKSGEIVNLHNLIGKCLKAADKSTWNKIIQEHFESLFASMDEQSSIDPTNYEKVKRYLSLRIYPRETITQRGGVEYLVSRVDLEGTFTLLMLDLPGAFTPVQKQMFDFWKVGKDTVFKEAQANINKQSVEKVTRSFDVDGTNIELSFIGNEDYAASYALDLLNNLPDMVGEWGSVVAIPNKGLVDICKVSREKPVDFVKFIQLTKPSVEKYYREHSQPVSKEYFWYYKGKFTRIDVQDKGSGNISVVSPMELTQLMTEKK